MPYLHPERRADLRCLGLIGGRGLIVATDHELTVLPPVGKDGGVIDYHVHLWRHALHLSLPASVEQLAAYCAQAARLGVTELAVAEHSSRFRHFDALVRVWWDQDPSPARRTETGTCWDEELGADLDQYVDTALAAKPAGLPVVLGSEVDYVPGRMGEVGTLLAGYPFDVLLGQRALDRRLAVRRPRLGAGAATMGQPGRGARLVRLHPLSGGAGGRWDG